MADNDNLQGDSLIHISVQLEDTQMETLKDLESPRIL